MQEKHEIEKLDLLKTILTKEEYFIKTLEENRLFAVISLIMFLTILFTSPEMISAFWIIIVFMVVSMNEKIKKTRASIISIENEIKELEKIIKHKEKKAYLRELMREREELEKDIKYEMEEDSYISSTDKKLQKASSAILRLNKERLGNIKKEIAELEKELKN